MRLVALLLATGVVLASCDRDQHEYSESAASSETAHPAGEHAHGHDDEAGSDLDRPVAELFEQACEHSIKAYQCDECRYEVGVVRVAPALIEGKLVKVAKVDRRPPQEALALTGEVRLDETVVVHISTRTPGIIRKVHVQPGQIVKKGDRLLQVDSSQVGDAQGEYQEARAALGLAEQNLERLQALRAGGITSDKQYQQAQQEHEVAKIRAQVTAAKLARLGAGAGAGGGRLSIRAPAAGTVIDMHAVVGETAEPDQSVLVLGDLSSLWVFADLYEHDLARLLQETKRGEVAAGVRVRAFGDQEFPGKVGLVSSTMDRASRTVKVRVDVANPDGLLRPGMFANLRLYLRGAGEVVAVPHSAVLQDEGRSFVFVHHEGEYFVRRPVTVGRGWGEWVEIKAGVTTGKRIAADGSFLLKSDVLRSKMGAGCAD